MIEIKSGDGDRVIYMAYLGWANSFLSSIVLRYYRTLGEEQTTKVSSMTEKAWSMEIKELQDFDKVVAMAKAIYPGNSFCSTPELPIKLKIELQPGTRIWKIWYPEAPRVMDYSLSLALLLAVQSQESA